MAEPAEPFWKTIPIDQMTHDQWESLCDGCGRCCLHKFENRKNGKVRYTNVACYLLDIRRCRCRDYAHRMTLVRDCLQLTPVKVAEFRWLPETCAYRIVARGGELPWWHPLVAKNAAAVHDAGISVRDMAISEEIVHPDDLEYYVLDAKF